eukprot:gene17651-23996_t
MSAPRGAEGFIDVMSVCGLCLLAASALLSLPAWYHGRTVKELEKAFPVNQLRDLEHLDKILPIIVAARGIVGCDDPKRCELSDSRAVIYEITEEEIWRKDGDGRNDYDKPIKIRQATELCEWHLEDGSSQLRIEDASSARGVSSVMQRKQVYTPLKFSIAGNIVRFLSSSTWKMAKAGVRKTERYLPVGSTITVIGEVSHNPLHGLQSTLQSASSRAPRSMLLSNLRDVNLSDTRACLASTAAAAIVAAEAAPLASCPFVLRRPSQGPFYITSLTLDQLHGSMSRVSKRYKLSQKLGGSQGLVDLQGMLQQGVVIKILIESQGPVLFVSTEALRWFSLPVATCAAAVFVGRNVMRCAQYAELSVDQSKYRGLRGSRCARPAGHRPRDNGFQRTPNLNQDGRTTYSSPFVFKRLVQGSRLCARGLKRCFDTKKLTNKCAELGMPLLSLPAPYHWC